jgi:hypothetical protein
MNAVANNRSFVASLLRMTREKVPGDMQRGLPSTSN